MHLWRIKRNISKIGAILENSLPQWLVLFVLENFEKKTKHLLHQQLNTMTTVFERWNLVEMIPTKKCVVAKRKKLLIDHVPEIGCSLAFHVTVFTALSVSSLARFLLIGFAFFSEYFFKNLLVHCLRKSHIKGTPLCSQEDNSENGVRNCRLPLYGII